MVMKFYKESFIKAEPSEVYRWHMAPGAFLRLKPPWENVELVNSEKELFEGARALIRIFPLANTRTIYIDWLAEHTDIELNKGFTDFQVRGPFKRWRHRHRFQEHNGGCLLQDEIEFELLAHPLSIPLYPYIRSKLEAMFTYRHEITQKDLDSKGANSMNVLISGSSGLVGGALVPYLSTAGHSVTRLKRSLSSRNDAKEILWSPGAGELDAAALEGIDAVVHLAGENIASGRWTDAKKKELVDSRIQSTRLLVDSFKKMEKKPSVFICASAIGFYGERGDEELTEESSAGSGFLADLCKDWEKEAAKAEALGIRTVMLRIGVVLSPEGGMLAKVLPPFQMGAGGNIGSGSQYMSWIALDDLIGLIKFALENDSVEGPLNAVAPEAVTNAQFTRVLGKVLGRPTIFPVPTFAARLLFGEMAEETMLASTRVAPDKAEKAGYQFRYPGAESALRHLLGKK